MVCTSTRVEATAERALYCRCTLNMLIRNRNNMIARIDPNPRYNFLPIVIKTASADGSANFDLRNDIAVFSRFHFRSETAGLIASLSSGSARIAACGWVGFFPMWLGRGQKSRRIRAVKLQCQGHDAS